MNQRRRFIAAIAGTAAATALTASPASAQDYPSRPVRVLVGFSAGGGADAIARTLAQKLGDQLGQSVVVENRPGASSTIAAATLSTSAPDGYTLMLADSSLLIAAKAMRKVNFDPLASFAPVSAVAVAPLVIAVNPKAQVQSLEDLARLSKEGKEQLYATSGIGTVHHLAMEYLQAQAKIKMVHLPYRGASQIIPDLISGEVPIGVISAAAALGHVKAGKIKVIGVTSPQKLPEAPNWRAIADWLPGFDASPRLFLLAPSGTPKAVIDKLDAATQKLLKDPKVAETLIRQGAIPSPASSEELGRTMRTELERWDMLVKQANVKLD